MSASDSLEKLRPAVAATQGFLDAAGVPGAIIGGLAVALVARPRSTKDVDATIFAGTADLEQLLGLATGFGLAPDQGTPWVSGVNSA